MATQQPPQRTRRPAMVATPSQLAPKPLSVTDPAYHSIGLPSNFQWYPFKQLSVRPLRVPEIKKLYTANVTNSFRALIEALAPCLDQDIFALTVGDLYYVMFWLRLNSYQKSKYLVQFGCEDPDHINKVVRKPKRGTKQLDAKTLQNEHIISATDLEVVDMKPLAEIQQFVATMELVKAGVAFYPSCVRDLVEIEELAAEESFDPGDDFLCKYASYLDQRHGVTLKERYEFIMADDRFNPDSIAEMDALIELLTHGINESTTLKCKECGASKRVEIPIDARSFLPSLQ